jgi:hypothetical protein
MTFFGFMHGEQIGIGEHLPIVVGYLLVAGICAVAAKTADVPAVVPVEVLHETAAESLA